MAISDITSKMPFVGGGSGGSNIIYLIIGFAVLLICGFALWWFLKKRKTWNIKVEFKIPRNIKKVKTKHKGDGNQIIFPAELLHNLSQTRSLIEQTALEIALAGISFGNHLSSLLVS